jgi:Flp pilus assembly protein TadD
MKLLLAVLASALLSSCATVPPVDVETMLSDAEFEEYRAVHEAADIFALTPAMRGYLAREVLPAVHSRGPQKGLVEALYSTEHLRLSYEALTTRTASEAFEARAGNCLSLVIMTAAFAKTMGLETRYQQVRAEDLWVRDGNLVHLVGHVNLALGRGQSIVHRASSPVEWLTVDFIPLEDAQHLRSLVIGEDRVIAMYYNNKAAEALSGGMTGPAYWWARAAVQADRRYAAAAVTMGVVMHRQGLLDKAELAQRAALQLDPDSAPALHNLAAMLQASGRAQEGAQVLRRLKAVEPDNPITAHAAGMLAFQSGDFVRARDAFRSAVRRAPDDQEFHFMLAMSHQRLGDTQQAIEHLQRAQALAPTADRRRAYAEKIARIQAAGDGSVVPLAVQ